MYHSKAFNFVYHWRQLFMIYEFNFWKALVHPTTSFYQVSKTESIYRLRSRMIVLFLCSFIIFTVAGILGIGAESLSKDLTVLQPHEFEIRKALFALGKGLSGLLYAAVLTFFTALLFWVFTGIDYKKLLVFQSLVLGIHLIEVVVNGSLLLTAGLPWYSSPFSLGVLMQSMTAKNFFIYLFGSISLFKGWAIYLQYKGLRACIQKSRAAILGIVIGVNLAYWIITALLAYIDFHAIL